MSTTENPGNFVLAPITAPDAQKAITALAAWDAMAQGAYSKNTRRAWQADPVRAYAAAARAVGCTVVLIRFQFVPSKVQVSSKYRV